MKLCGASGHSKRRGSAHAWNLAEQSLPSKHCSRPRSLNLEMHVRFCGCAFARQSVATVSMWSLLHGLCGAGPLPAVSRHWHEQRGGTHSSWALMTTLSMILQQLHGGCCASVKQSFQRTLLL